MFNNLRGPSDLDSKGHEFTLTLLNIPVKQNLVRRGRFALPCPKTPGSEPGVYAFHHRRTGRPSTHVSWCGMEESNLRLMVPNHECLPLHQSHTGRRGRTRTSALFRGRGYSPVSSPLDHPPEKQKRRWVHHPAAWVLLSLCESPSPHPYRVNSSAAMMDVGISRELV